MILLVKYLLEISDSGQNRSPALHEQGNSDDHVPQHSLWIGRGVTKK